jgi:thiol-disulfide isomerase/thioredoxin
MRYLLTAVLYTALATTANADIAALEGLRTGDMRKLQFHSEIIKAPEVAFIRADGSEGVLSDYSGKVVVLNFWATWCAPCRKEMPELSALQSTIGRDDFAVVTIATGPNPPAKIAAFFDDIQIDNLPAHRDLLAFGGGGGFSPVQQPYGGCLARPLHPALQHIPPACEMSRLRERMVVLCHS